MVRWRRVSAEVLRLFARGLRVDHQGVDAPPVASEQPETGRGVLSVSRGTAESPYAVYHRRQDEAMLSCGPFPAERFSGRGIVIVAGGPRYFTNAWVCLWVLRRVLGCSLPIQVWYLGPSEMSPRMLELLQRFEVECVDATQVRHQYPVRTLGGWECKPYAILHSRFREVILLDADNVPLVEPSLLCSTEEFRQTGAIFWPDKQALNPDSAIWEICRLPYQPGPELEAGQIVVDKARGWGALNLAMHLNEWSEFYYQHLHGDKDTYQLAWRMLGQPFSLVPHPPRQVLARYDDDRFLREILEQHDFEGRVIFHHRSGGSKWVAWGRNLPLPDFPLQAECLRALDELREVWDGRVMAEPGIRLAGSGRADLVRQRTFLYCRLGADERPLELLPDGQLGQGSARCEQRWRLDGPQDKPVLVIEGQDGVTCQLRPDRDGTWCGHWLHYERTPVELIPLDPPSADRASAAG